jgi:hypothetical protein
MTLELGKDLAEVGDVVCLAFDDVAERALSDQAIVGDGGG